MVKRWPLIFWIAGAACLGLSAAFMFGRFGMGGSERPCRADTTCGRIVPTTLPASLVNPADIASQPLTGTGLEILRTGADDAFAPPGAVRRYALRKKVPDGAEDIIAYTIEANIADVEKFYSDRLTKAGYKLMQRAPAMQPGGISLVFLRKMQRYCVSLRQADKEKKTVKILLVISRPGR
ncbi:MAG: hypothetical protein K8R91_01160 [Phycisphaerae bacterium]|nr:hypothetical protein [Phycisphaerae bacterium]